MGDAGDGKTTYAYDTIDRLKSIDYSDSTPDVTFAYDGNDNRTGIAGAVSLLVLALLYRADGLPELLVGAAIGSAVTWLGYRHAAAERSARVEASSPAQPSSRFSRRDLASLLGFVAFFLVVILAAAGLGAAMDRSLPADDPIDIGAFVGGGLSGALLGISIAARIVQRHSRL